MEHIPFIRWSAPHIIALILTVLVAVLVLWLGSRMKERGRFILCRILGGIVFFQLVSEFIWRAFADDYGPWEYNLPLHFCSFMSLFAFIALWWRVRWACAIVYFGVLAGSIQGLITPAMANGYPSLAFFIFFIAHSLLLIVALAIPVLLEWRARGWDDLRSLLIMNAYVLLIHPINLWLNTNYGYTMGPPIAGTLLDYLGPAPWYYLWAQLPVWALLRLLMIPVHDRNAE